MLRVRTIVGAMLGLAFALTASMPVAAPAAPAVPPDGTYTYALAQGGNPVGTSTVTIAHAGAVLVVRERAMLGAATYETRATFDPATLQETHYTVHAAPADVDVDFSGTTARMHLPGAMLPLPAPNGSALVVSDGLVSSFALLPALHKALGPIAFATTVRPHVTPLTFGPAAAARPANVPANDVGFDATSDTGTYTLWYDPATLVLAYFGYPALSFTYRLTGSTSTVAPESAAGPVSSPSPSPSPIALSRARYASREVRFASRDGTMLAGTLTVPNDARGPVAAVVLVHGSGPLDRDETIGPNKIFLQIAHALSNRNFAVLRY
ncbi:MAG: hypothetical protein JOZ24_00605, partial [Candidatus Eremiobacteraeota bacterium]|nr:hypothetical protein [Candidatus Eremiobacteraeota bacterium]